MPVHRIEALVAPGNSGSIRLLEKLGFSREGLRREFGFWKGRYQDVYLYALLNLYRDRVFEGYTRENSLSDEWLKLMPLFLRLIQMQELMHYAKDLDDSELQAELDYKIRCIEDNIPYMGFFDSVYSPEKPFALSP